MGDPRVRDIGAYFYKHLYKKKYHVEYPWSFRKDGAIVKRILQYFDNQFPGEGLEKFKQALENFLQDNSNDYVNNAKHPLESFAKRPQKWLVIEKEEAPKKRCSECGGTGMVRRGDKQTGTWYKCKCR